MPAQVTRQEFDALSARVSALETRTTAVEVNVGSLTSRMGAAESTLGAHGNDIADLQARVTALEGPPPTPPPEPTPDVLLHAADFTYLGAFRLEHVWSGDYKHLESSNGAIAILPSGRLLVSSHIYVSWVRKFVIPTPVVSADLNALPIAAADGPWIDIHPAGNIDGFLMGMVTAPDGWLYGQWSTDYGDYTINYPHLFRVPADTLVGVEGAWNVPGQDRFECGRMVAARGTNLYLARQRGAGSGKGPNIYQVPQGGAPATCDILVEYDDLNVGREWSTADAYRGLAWIDTGTKRALVMTGLKDYNPAAAYYGYENGVLPENCEPTGTCVGQRGHRAGDARPALMLWDMDTLSGPVNQRYWYEKIDLTANFFNVYGPQFLATGSDAEDCLCSYDAVTKRLYVCESFAAPAADGTPKKVPVVHVYQLP